MASGTNRTENTTTQIAKNSKRDGAYPYRTGQSVTRIAQKCYLQRVKLLPKSKNSYSNG